MLTYTLKKTPGHPLYEQLYQSIRDDIAAGRLPAGSRLPSKRVLAAHLGVSVVTVESAYAQLAAEGYIVSREKSGYFVVQIPVVSQMATVLYAGGRSYADAPDKNDTIPFFYQPEFDLPLVAGCAGWLVCKVMPYPDIQQQHNLFMGDIVAAWSDDRVFRNGHWIFDDAPDELRTVHYVAGGQFYAIGKGSKFDHGPGKD
mgnify:CR=1 FL=1